MAEPIRMMPGEAPRKSNTCLIGCIATIVILSVIVFVAVLGVLYLGRQLRDNLTSDAPMPLPPVQYSGEQAQEVQQRLAAFEAVVKGEAAEPLQIELTSEDLNVLLHTDSRVNMLADKAYVNIEGDALKAQVSVPLDFLPGMQGRYVNGTAAVDLDVVNDRFVVTLNDFMMQGNQAPGQMLTQMEGEINTNLNQDPRVRELAQRVQDIQVQDGKIRITLKGGQQ